MKAWLALLTLWATTASAHEVYHRIVAAETVVITLAYANGEPFAYEKYALYPAGQTSPRQVGNTDAQGRIAFVPDDVERWRVQATSADGHGVDFEFSAPTVTTPAASAPPMPRWLLAGFGVSIIFGLFGLLQLFLRKKPCNDCSPPSS